MGAPGSGECEIHLRRPDLAVKSMFAAGPLSLDPVQEQVGRPPVRIGRYSSVPVIDALVENRVPNPHCDGRESFAGEILVHLRRRVCSPLLDLEIPDTIVAVSERQGEAVLARIAVGMNAAPVILPIDSEIIIGREQVSSHDPADGRGQSPEEVEQRLVEMALGLEARPAKEIDMLLDAAERDRPVAQILLEALQEGHCDFGFDQALQMGIAVGPIVSKNVQRHLNHLPVGSLRRFVLSPASTGNPPLPAAELW